MRKQKAKAQEANCAMTVAMAAPATSICRTKIKTGSRIMLVTALSAQWSFPHREIPGR